MSQTETIRTQALRQINNDMVKEQFASLFEVVRGETVFYQIHKNVDNVSARVWRNSFYLPQSRIETPWKYLFLSGTILYNGGNPTAPEQTYTYKVVLSPLKNGNGTCNLDIYTEKKLFGLFRVKKPLPAPYPIDLLHRVLQDVTLCLRQAYKESLEYDRKCKNEYHALQNRLMEIKHQRKG